MRLTDAGLVFLQEAKVIVERFDHAIATMRQAQQGQAGRLVIGYVSTAGYDVLPRLLHAYRQHSPLVETVLRKMTTGEQVQALKDHDLHVGLLRPPIGETMLGTQVIHRDPLLVALPEAHPLAKQRIVSPRALAKQPFVFYGSNRGSGYYDQVMALCERSGFRPTVVQEASELPTILGLVAAGIGVCLVPSSARQLRSQGVAYRQLSGTAFTLDIALAWRIDDTSPLIQTLLHVLPSTALGSAA